jgi:cation transport ATPase
MGETVLLRKDSTTHFVLFGVTWLVLMVFVPFAFGATLERKSWFALLVIGVIILGMVLFYVIGRPIELEALQGQGFYPAFRNTRHEIQLPLLVGLAAAFVYGLSYWFTRHIMETSRGVWRSFQAGVALYLLTGLFLWLQSGVAWFLIRVLAGIAPESGQWARFVDEVGPHSVFLQVLAWPATVYVFCCG